MVILRIVLDLYDFVYLYIYEGTLRWFTYITYENCIDLISP